MTKKILAVVMALALMLTACTMMAFAEETPTDVAEFLLKLEPNGAQGKMENIVADADGKVVVPEHAFTNDNYNFTGWNVNADGSDETVYKAGDEIVLTKENTDENGVFVLYAQWIHKEAQFDEFTVTYDANGGQGEVIDEFNPYISGGYVYTCYNDFTYGSATFVGWNTKPDGTGTMYEEDEMFEIYEDVVLYAIWDGVEEVPSEPETSTPEVQEPEKDVTETETNNPKTGSTSAAGAVVAGVVALGALVVLKKRG